MKFLNNVDLNKNELQNARIQNLASAPGSPAVGQVYYDTTDVTAKVWNGTAWVPVDASKIANGAIPLAKLATDPLARANHTGTQAASTISDFDTQVRTSRLDQMAAPTASVSANGQKFTNLGAPTPGTNDAARIIDIENAIAGLGWKEAVRAATTGNITLSGLQTIDSVSIASGERVLVKAQSTGSQNGVYLANSGAWTRALDADSEADLRGMAVMVEEGGQAGTQWVLTTDAPITPGTTSLAYVQFGGGATYTAGNGLTLAANDFNVGAGTGITVAADSVAIDPAVVVRKYSASIGDGSSTSIVVTHNLNTKDIQVQMRQNSDDAFVQADVVATSVNTCTITFSVAPASNAIRVTVFA